MALPTFARLPGLACAAGILALAGCGSANQGVPPARPANPGGAPAPGKTALHRYRHLRIIDVSIRSGGVSPRVVPTKPGARVRWTNRDDRVHTVTSRHGASQSFDSGPLRPGQSFVITATSRGDAPYRSASPGDGKKFAGLVEVG